MSNVIGYFTHFQDLKEINSYNVFVAIDEPFDLDGNITCYCPVGQHGALSKEYLKECREITRRQYLRVSKGIYTPEEYLKEVVKYESMAS